MPRNITQSGRPLSTDEQLFVAALVEQLNRERERRGYDQRQLALYIGVSDSLLSLYRSGQRHPSQMAMIEMDKKFPGLWLRVVQGYYRLTRQRDLAAQGRRLDGETDETEDDGVHEQRRVPCAV